MDDSRCRIETRAIKWPTPVSIPDLTSQVWRKRYAGVCGAQLVGLVSPAHTMSGSSVTARAETDSFPWCCWCRWLMLKEIEWRARGCQHWLNQWSVQETLRDKLAERLVFLHLCTTYPVTGKQLRTHQGWTTNLPNIWSGCGLVLKHNLLRINPSPRRNLHCTLKTFLLHY